MSMQNDYLSDYSVNNFTLSTLLFGPFYEAYLNLGKAAQGKSWGHTFKHITAAFCLAIPGVHIISHIALHCLFSKEKPVDTSAIKAAEKAAEKILKSQKQLAAEIERLASKFASERQSMHVRPPYLITLKSLAEKANQYQTNRPKDIDEAEVTRSKAVIDNVDSVLKLIKIDCDENHFKTIAMVLDTRFLTNELPNLKGQLVSVKEFLEKNSTVKSELNKKAIIQLSSKQLTLQASPPPLTTKKLSIISPANTQPPIKMAPPPTPKPITPKPTLTIPLTSTTQKSSTLRSKSPKRAKSPSRSRSKSPKSSKTIKSPSSSSSKRTLSPRRFSTLKITPKREAPAVPESLHTTADAISIMVSNFLRKRDKGSYTKPYQTFLQIFEKCKEFKPFVTQVSIPDKKKTLTDIERAKLDSDRKSIEKVSIQLDLLIEQVRDDLKNKWYHKLAETDKDIKVALGDLYPKAISAKHDIKILAAEFEKQQFNIEKRLAKK